MLNVSSWSIRNPTPSVLLFIMLTLVGLMGFRAMKIQNFPDIDLPTVTVTAALPGASPAQMETEVARKIENSVATLQGVKHIYTKVQDGTAIITVEFRLEKPTQEAVDDVRDAVSRVRSDLPADLRDPVIRKMELAGTPILTYTVASSRMDDEALSWFVDNQVTQDDARGAGRRARCRASAAQPARCASSSIPASCWRSTPPPPTSRASCGRCSRRPRADASTSAAPSSRCGRSPPCVRPTSWRRSEMTLSDGRRIRLDQVATVSDTVGRAALGRAAERQAGGRLRDRALARRGRGRRRRRRARRARTAARQSIPRSASPRRSTSSIRWSRTTTAR